MKQWKVTDGTHTAIVEANLRGKALKKALKLPEFADTDFDDLQISLEVE